MYQEEYKRWLAAELEDADLKPELAKIEGKRREDQGPLCCGAEVWHSRPAGRPGGWHQPDEYLCGPSGHPGPGQLGQDPGRRPRRWRSGYDSRLKSDVFAKTAAGVLAANGIKVRIYDALMPVPALSFATRYYQCNAGIMVTASHNPARVERLTKPTARMAAR